MKWHENPKLSVPRALDDVRRFIYGKRSKWIANNRRQIRDKLSQALGHVMDADIGVEAFTEILISSFKTRPIVKQPVLEEICFLIQQGSDESFCAELAEQLRGSNDESLKNLADFLLAPLAS